MPETVIPYDSASDEQLCALSAEGDRAAEEQLILRYRRSVLAASRSYFLMGGDNDDLIQEGMIGLIKAIRSYDAARKAAFRTYAAHCVRNALISAVRSAAGDKHAPLNTGISFETPSLDEDSDRITGQAAGNDPEGLMILEENFRECLSAIRSQLSGFEAKILGLYLRGLSYSEIASQVDRPVKSVDNAVQRIRKKLSRVLIHGDISRS